MIDKEKAEKIFAAIIYGSGADKRALSSYKEIKIEKKELWHSGEQTLDSTLITAEYERWELSSPELQYTYVLNKDFSWAYRKKNGSRYQIDARAYSYMFAMMFELDPKYQKDLLRDIIL